MPRRDIDDGHPLLAPGEYGRGIQGIWFACPPGYPELVANLRNHRVEEHEDGTITVEPSILLTQSLTGGRDGAQWHGYLRRGEWQALPDCWHRPKQDHDHA